MESEALLGETLVSIRKRFENLKALGDGALAQVTPGEYALEPAAGCNSLAIQIKHMHGNMCSRWTDFLTRDGEKSWRERDEEFALTPDYGAEQWLALWDGGWACLFNAIGDLRPEDLGAEITIRGQAMPAIDAINRQLTHYGYHVGQIVLQVKMLRGGDWVTLSIARGESKAYTPSPRD